VEGNHAAGILGDEQASIVDGHTHRYDYSPLSAATPMG
jgi:hypothetical protein